MQSDARYIVLACGRRWGKTILGQNWIVEPALEGYPVGWFAPSHKYMTEVWRDLTRYLAPVTRTKDASEHRLELITGGVIECWSVHANSDAGRSRKYARAFLDEAAKIVHLRELWNGALRPTLADYRGQAMFGSSPKGHNYFHDLFLRGGDRENWASYQYPTESNPYLPRSEIAELKAEVAGGDIPEQYYQQEYMAQFLELDGAVFRGVAKASICDYQDGPIRGRTYVGGADWGMTNDRTVLTAIDADDYRQVDMIRFTNKDFNEQMTRVLAFCKKWTLSVVLGEDNSIGKPFVQEMRRRGVPVQNWTATNATKATVIQDLALDIEMGKLFLLDDPVQIGELMAYEAERLPSGLIRYGAPSGLHDDTVMALAIANAARKKGGKRRQIRTIKRF